VRRRRIATPAELYERGEHGGCRVAVAAKSARRTVVDAIGESLGHARTARTVLRERRRARARADHAAIAGCEGGHRTCLAIDLGHQRARRERGQRSTPRTRPHADGGVLDDELEAVVGDDVGGDLPRVIPPRTRGGLGFGNLRGAQPVVASRDSSRR
jgi:hypothetical protein